MVQEFHLCRLNTNAPDCPYSFVILMISIIISVCPLFVRFPKWGATSLQVKQFWDIAKTSNTWDYHRIRLKLENSSGLTKQSVKAKNKTSPFQLQKRLTITNVRLSSKPPSTLILHLWTFFLHLLTFILHPSCFNFHHSFFILHTSFRNF